MLTTKHAKYEGLTLPELGEKNLIQLTLVFYLLTLGNPWFPIVFLNKINDLAKKPELEVDQVYSPS